MDSRRLIGAGRTAEIYEWDEGRVLKLYFDWFPAHEVDHEARITGMIADAGIAAPQVYDVIDQDGRRGIIMQRIAGESMLQRARRDMTQAEALIRQFAEAHLRIHAAVAPGLPRQRDHLEYDISHAPLLTESLRAAALERLYALPSGDRVCHGDYHPDNLLLTADGVVIIDWIAAVQGNPLADVARTVVVLGGGSLPESDAATISANALSANAFIEQTRALLLNSYLDRYFADQPDARAEMERWIPMMAAARLKEGIEKENARLIGIVEQAFA